MRSLALTCTTEDYSLHPMLGQRMSSAGRTPPLPNIHSVMVQSETSVNFDSYSTPLNHQNWKKDPILNLWQILATSKCALCQHQRKRDSYSTLIRPLKIQRGNASASPARLFTSTVPTLPHWVFLRIARNSTSLCGMLSGIDQESASPCRPAGNHASCIYSSLYCHFFWQSPRVFRWVSSVAFPVAHRSGHNRTTRRDDCLSPNRTLRHEYYVDRVPLSRCHRLRRNAWDSLITSDGMTEPSCHRYTYRGPLWISHHWNNE